MEILKVEIWGGDVFKTIYVTKVDWVYTKAIIEKYHFDFLIIDSFSVIGTGQVEQITKQLESVCA
jgi:hypothetical protein